MSPADTHAAIEWPTLMTICRIAAEYFSYEPDLVAGTTRIDELEKDELVVVGFFSEVERALRCDIPDLDVSTTLTLAQLATLAEKYRVSR